MFNRRRKLSPEEVAANAAEREARKQAAMTCQICGRDILANKGRIAHHGYQRPGYGWQTGSCQGALKDPFEVSRDDLGRYIEAIKARLQFVRDHIAKVDAEEAEFAVTFSDRTQPRDHRFRHPSKTVRLSRATFAEVAADPANRDLTSGRYGNDREFDAFKGRYLAVQRAEETSLVDHIELQSGRFSAWKQTHERAGDQWKQI